MTKLYLYENHGHGAKVVYGVDSAAIEIGQLTAYVLKVEATRGRWLSLAGDSFYRHMGEAVRLTVRMARAIDASAAMVVAYAEDRDPCADAAIIALDGAL